MELQDFVGALARLSGQDLRALGTAIDAHHATVADEVEAWEDMMAIDDALRRAGRSRVAARAAHDAVQAVQRAAAEASDELPATLVTRVAREAALLARALVAGEDAHGAVRHLLVEWTQLSVTAA